MEVLLAPRIRDFWKTKIKGQTLKHHLHRNQSQTVRARPSKPAANSDDVSDDDNEISSHIDDGNELVDNLTNTSQKNREPETKRERSDSKILF